MKLINKIASDLSKLNKNELIALCTALLMINHDWNNDLDWQGIIKSVSENNNKQEINKNDSD
jgi:hypothetical protein